MPSAISGAAGTTLTVTTGAGSKVIGATNGIEAINLGTGVTTISVNGAVTGTSGHGVSASNNTILTPTGTTPIVLSIGTTGVVKGGTDGVFASSTTAPITLANAGSIGNLSGVSSDLAIATVGGPTAITNTGLVTGVVALGNGGNSFANSGVWNTAGGTNTFGTGANSVNNLANGTIIAAAAGATAPVTTTFNGLGTFANAGVLTMQNGVAGDQSVITGNYVGKGGTVRLDTALGADGSASDQLVLNGGSASGTTNLAIANAGGLGALTVFDGIKVVSATNGAFTANGAFQLANRVAAGAYEYKLYAGGNPATGGNANDQNYYLRDTLVPVIPPVIPPVVTPPLATPPATILPPIPPVATPPAAAPAPAARAVPNYRVEVPTYMVAPVMAQAIGMLTLGTLDERVGSEFTDPAGTNTKPNGSLRLWGRALGQTADHNNGHSYSNFISNGPSYSLGMGGIQVGADLYRATRESGSSDVAGFYLAGVNGTSDVQSAYSTLRAGRVQMDGYSLAGYWTHYANSGWYTDVVLQGTTYQNVKANSTGGQTLSTSGAGFLASAETGWKLALASGLTVTPEAQLIYQTVSLNAGNDHYGHVQYGSSDAAYGRLGAKLTKVWNVAFGGEVRPLTTWARASVWHNFNSKADTTFSTLNGSNATTLGANLGNSWTSLTLGVSSPLSRGLSVFASGDVSIPLQRAGLTVGGSAGIKYAW